MIPPKAKTLILSAVEKYAPQLKMFRNSNPVIMLGELKLDRIDQKISKQAIKLNARQISKDVKLQGSKKKYEKRKAAITYRSYTVDFKRKLIQRIREFDSTSNVGLSKIIRLKARELSIHPKNIFRWFHTKEIKKKQGGRKARFPQMEERLAQFIINNPKMKRKHILRQAKQIMDDLQIPGRQYFNFSKGWYERFRQRLVRRKIIPGKIEHIKKQNFLDDSDSDYDELEYSIKKQQYGLKYENQDVKIQAYDESSEDEYKIKVKYEQGEENLTKMNGDQFVLFYQEIERKEQQPSKREKTQKKEKKQNVKMLVIQKKQVNRATDEVKTDESYENRSFDQSNSYGSSKQPEISIFASSEQNQEPKK